MERKPPAVIPPDRELWRQSGAVDAPHDETEHFLDLAAFADGLLDQDEHERVAERLACDADLATDVAAARALSDTAHHGPVPGAVLAAARALVGDGPGRAGDVVAFAPRRTSASQGLTRWATQWGSLAAAIAVAGWLGFTLGMDVQGALMQTARAGDEGILDDFFDAPGGIVRDLTEGPRT